MANTRLQYPRTSVENTGLFLTFRAYDYNKAPTPSGAIADIRDIISSSNSDVDLNASTVNSNLTRVFDSAASTETVSNPAVRATNTENAGDNTGVANISLSLPPKVEYQYGAEWQKVSFGALGSVLGTGSAGGFGTAVAGGIGAIGANFFFDKLKDTAGFQAIPKVDNISIDTLVGAAFGQTFNDNTLQTFNKMQTRSFAFDYIMLARSIEEEEEIRKIIKQFKLGMHPDSKIQGRSNSLFLKYPYIWRIIPSGYKGKMRRRSNGVTIDVNANTPKVSDFLPNTKYCALTGLNVDYTPDNVMALTQRGFVQAVRLSLQFSELTTLVRQDIDGFEDKTIMNDTRG
jgi:hypothetical protein